MLFHIAAAAVLTNIAFLEIYPYYNIPDSTDMQFLSDEGSTFDTDLPNGPAQCSYPLCGSSAAYNIENIPDPRSHIKPLGNERETVLWIYRTNERDRKEFP